jgi:hypothetical protein
VAASLAGHQRARQDVERELRELTIRIGTQAIERRVQSPHLDGDQGAYARFDRLTETIRSTEGALAGLENLRGGLDQRKLATGLGVLLASVAIAIVTLWRLLR